MCTTKKNVSCHTRLSVICSFSLVPIKQMEYSELGDMKSFAGLFKADETTTLQPANTKSDSFTVEMERLSELSSKNVSPNSRITLQRNLSRKGPYRGEKKMNSNADNDKDATNSVPVSSSPKAAQLIDSSTPEKPILVTVGATNHPFSQQVHHQITITTTATTESKLGSRRNSFKRSSWTIDPRRMLLFFATMSSMGTILLIYLTLSMRNVGGDANTMGQ
ncbi:Axin-1 like [Heracleum sosnowskyi]|uniref:Axin-1 like n=1 Tax=Heracleum sosnowskyi TaxID=360622 RepID=A0AAD8HX97_9APIA|nr:Axin-1 like [Heracleum sosnowskyi]